MTTSPDPKCTTCGIRQSNHPVGVRHAFNDGSMTASETFGQRRPDGSRGPAPTSGPQVQVVEQPWPFDPVLRQALIDKGVITPDDLVNAERTIRAVTAQFMSGGQT